MKINFLSPVLALALIASLLLFAYQCRDARSDRDMYNSRIADLEAKDAEFTTYKKLAQATIDSLDVRRTKQRVVDSLALSGLKIKSRAMSQNLAQARAKIQAVIDSIPEVKVFVVTNDSLLQIKDSTILALEMSKLTQMRSFQAELRIKDELQARTEGQVTMFRDVSERSAKDLKKEQRKKRLWRGLTVITGTIAGVLLLTSQ